MASFVTSKKIAAAALSAGLMIGVTACSPYMKAGPNFDTKHKIQVAETVERMEIYIRPTGLNLSARDRAAMRQFIGLYGQEGDGAMFLNIPSNAAGSQGMSQAQREIQNLLMQAGLSGARVQTGQYNAHPNAAAPLVLSFRRLGVVPRDCGVTDDLIPSHNNQPHDNFGCAGMTNLGILASDPRQLLEPYPVDKRVGPRE